MLVVLPSRATAPLDVPSLPALLAAGGDVAAIAACAFAHDEVSPSDLRDADTYFIASWAVEEFAASDDALELAIVCDAWHRAPSEAVGLTDVSLAWLLDCALYLRLRATSTSPAASDEDEEGVVRFSTPEVPE
jgi:hypothetical protein